LWEIDLRIAPGLPPWWHLGREGDVAQGFVLARRRHPASGFRVQGSGFRVQGSGCRVQG